ncbi:MAG: hypothetical protein KF678_15610 [Phycisphaeraceae bacterium]|nr:hypothetical protein [Phycisphaeraceae bacterium]
MSSLAFRRFTHAYALREVDSAALLELLRPHAAFLASHGAVLPTDPEQIDIERVEIALLTTIGDLPIDLVDALWHIHEMATPAGMESLLSAAEQTGLRLPGDRLAPADIAVRVWIADADLLRRCHSELSVSRRRSFETFVPAKGASLAWVPPGPETIAALDAAVGAWYVANRRGLGARVLFFDHGDELRFLIRHGGPYRREGSLDDGMPGCVRYRPMAHGIVVFDRRTWELRINSGTKRERIAYRELVGQHVFGRREMFPPDPDRYDLEPLRALGRRSLVCTDVPGLASVRLTELSLYVGGPYHRRKVEKADDVLVALDAAGETISSDALLTSATFEVRFTDGRKPRPVTIRHGNTASYTRDTDAEIIETFLRRRGFVKGVREVAHAALASA